MSINIQGMQRKVQPAINKISSNRYLKAIMGGMMTAFPATMVGALASLLKSFPVAAYQEFITSHGISKLLQLPITFTTNFLAVIFVFCIASSLAENFDEKGTIPGVLALISFLMLTPTQATKSIMGEAQIIPMDWLGATGIFSAIIVALLTARLYVFVVRRGWTIKMPDSVPPFIKESFASLVPGLIIVPIFIVIAGIFSNTTYGSVHQFIYAFLQTPLQHLGGNIGALIAVAIISQLLWVFGIHGTMVAFSVMMPIWSALDAAQLSAYSSGKPLPNIVGLSFFMVYTFGGTALGLNILMLKAKSQRFKTLGKLAIVPGIFGITEPIIFGTPLILNPVFAIPFIFGNVISLILGYIATVIHIVPAPAGVGVTGMPIFVQGLLQGSWRIGVLQLVLVLLWIVIWYPFFKMADNKAFAEETEVVQQ
ncbi:PTS transporter subunit EIIC [Clostridium sp. C8-1-8]|uniref:PTS sugar transporter subunit IIC n=1 Tax=Clostridium sp. C8-1-8 TaxID=2698831 RepID=UPI001920D805|nr:PTS transporter subunit EIIC [Clostridium sp. C8-1-8]